MPRFVLWNQEDCNPYLVRIDDEAEWVSTLRYLDDAGVSYSVQDIQPISSKILSDVVVERDD